MSSAVIGLGSNLGDRYENINRAVKALSLLNGTKVTDVSHIYDTAPIGHILQDNFLNACVAVETHMSPMALLGACLGIEAAFGRERKVDKGPRIIDLDLLLFEHVKSESFELTLPHPGILSRAFVMVPLNDLFPSGRAPGLYFGPHLRELTDAGVTRFDKEIEFRG